MATRAAPKTVLLTLFSQVTIPGNGNAISAGGGFDLTGYQEYRLVLRLEGAANAPFTLNEMYGPAGPVQQLNIDIDNGKLNTFGNLNYRRVFTVFGPKAMFIRVFNNGSAPLRVSGSLYAVQA